MIFGAKDVRQELGRFSGDNCETCTEGYIYRLVRVTRFLVVFFISLIPLGSRYEAVCDSCEAVKEMDKIEGRHIEKTEFRKRSAALNTVTALKLCALALVLAAAVALPLTLTRPATPGPQALKNMITEDGTYTIQGADGRVLGIVHQADGKKTLTFYEISSPLSGTSAGKHSYIKRDYYTESADGKLTKDGVKLTRKMDNPGLLEDWYGTAVRMYAYDASTASLSMARGVDKLSSIQYEDTRVIYPLSYTASDGSTQVFTTVLYLEPDAHIEATFVPSGDDLDLLAMVTVKRMENGRTTTETAYRLGTDSITAAIQQQIGSNSTAGEIMAFVESAGLTPVTELRYHYYDSTKVYTSVELTAADETGTMQTETQNFEITRKGRYYIQKILDEQ